MNSQKFLWLVDVAVQLVALDSEKSPLLTLERTKVENEN